MAKRRMIDYSRQLRDRQSHLSNKHKSPTNYNTNHIS